jgi:hypothetical protein
MGRRFLIPDNPLAMLFGSMQLMGSRPKCLISLWTIFSYGQMNVETAQARHLLLPHEQTPLRICYFRRDLQHRLADVHVRLARVSANCTTLTTAPLCSGHLQ